MKIHFWCFSLHFAFSWKGMGRFKKARQINANRRKTKRTFTFYCVHQIYSNMAECVGKNVLKYG